MGRLDWNGHRGYGERSGVGKRVLLATVAHYDAPTSHWRAFVLQDPVPGTFTTIEEAQAAAEQAVIDAGV